MTTEEEWDRAFELTMPVLGAVTGALSVALAAMVLWRPGPLAQRIYYQDGRYLVSVRYPGQWNDIREFVQPDNPDVLMRYSQIGPDPWGLYNWVCQNINYRRDVGEFWQFPSETLGGYGDCEDSSILLTSLLKNFTSAYTVLGSFEGWGHAWVVNKEGEILECTYTRARRVPDPEHYCPYCLFNDQQVGELWPGALSEVFDLRRDEASKLASIAEALNG